MDVAGAGQFSIAGTVTVTRFHTAVFALVLTVSGFAQEDATGPVVPPVPDEVRALLFHPPVAEAARRLTLAMALVAAGNDMPSAPEAWRTAVAAEQRRLADLAALSPVSHAGIADGRFAALVRAIAVPDAGIPRDDRHATMLDWLARPRLPALDAAVAAHWQSGAHLRLDAAWRAAAAGLTAPGEGLSVWQPLLDTAALAPETAGSGGSTAIGPPDLRGQALRLGALNGRLSAAGDDERPRAALELDLVRAEIAFDRGRMLDGLWHAFDAVLAGRGHPDTVVDLDLAGRLNRLNPVHRESLLAVDPVLGGVLAQLADAAADLAGSEDGNGVAAPLADAYAQLALFVTDAGFYLDQPVRQDIRADIEACRGALETEAPVARARYEACLEDFLGLTGDRSRSGELTGGADGPFAPEYLRRETGLVAAQRMDFLLGYVDWELGGGCEAAGWFNVLEWSLGAALVEWWAARRPAYFAAPRWQDAVAAARRGATTYGETLATHMDCLTGQGAQRRDPVVRLLDLLAGEIDTLSEHLETARTAYRDKVLAPGSDVRLDGDPQLTTRYRPEDLAVEPCDPARTCGVDQPLPVSRALVGLFPEAYLVADQTGMGRVELCYDHIEWVDRISRPARARRWSARWMRCSRGSARRTRRRSASARGGCSRSRTRRRTCSRTASRTSASCRRSFMPRASGRS